MIEKSKRVIMKLNIFFKFSTKILLFISIYTAQTVLCAMKNEKKINDSALQKAAQLKADRLLSNVREQARLNPELKFEKILLHYVLAQKTLQDMVLLYNGFSFEVKDQLEKYIKTLHDDEKNNKHSNQTYNKAKLKQFENYLNGQW